MLLSLMYYPDDHASRALDVICAADELGFTAAYLTDSSLRRDLWVLLGAAARRTRRIRLGPNAVRLAFRDPALIALSIATLDELTEGRAEAVVCFGGARFWQQHQLSAAHTSRPWARVKEAISVIKCLLADGALDFEGEYYQYRQIVPSVTPVQKRIPIKMATAGGPKAMHAAGEVADGMHIAPASTRAACLRSVSTVNAGARSVKRDAESMDVAICPIWVCGEESAAAKQIARIKAAWYLPTLPQANIDLQGIALEAVRRVCKAWSDGDVRRAIECTTDEITSALSIAGTPEECLEQLEARVVNTGVQHVVAMVTDSAHARLVTGERVPEVPTILEQLRMMHERVMPTIVDW